MRNHAVIGRKTILCAGAIAVWLASGSTGFAQAPAGSKSNLIPVPPQAPAQPGTAPITITLEDALRRARQNDPQFLAAMSDAGVAREDRLQARAALLPSAGIRSEFLNTQGNGVLPGGRYVTNDGVHVYREWGVFHQDLSPGTLTKTGYNRSFAVEAQAQAKAEIARRGLNVAVTKAYYALVGAQRKYATAQQSLMQSNRFLQISQDLERGGEVAHSDVVKFQLQQVTQEQALREAAFAIQSARLELAVFLSRDFDQNFEVVDDLQLTPAVPSLEEASAMASKDNPDVRAAFSAVRAAGYDVTAARQAFLPSLTVDVDYGLEANAIGLRSALPVDPTREVPTLGYFLTASLNLPIWDWGTRKSKVRQAELKRNQAQVELSAAQRTLLKNFNAAYQEVQAARDQVESLRRGVDLAAESLRLNTLRYQAGEAMVLDLVDAQSSLAQARNSLDDGEIRYKVAIMTLQTLTGTF